MLERLIEILNTVNPDIPTEGITEDTTLREDLELDSLNMMLLAVNVEEEYGFLFDDMPDFKTVGDLCAYIRSKTVSAED